MINFVLEKVSIGDVKYQKEDSAVALSCLEVTEETQAEYPGSCDVINITLGSDPTLENQPATFVSEFYEGEAACLAAGINTSNIIVYPPVPIANGSRTYELSLTVSNVAFSGTSNDLYLRLCADADRQDCTQVCEDYVAETFCLDDWFIFVGGVSEEGNTYKGYWNTKDIGRAKYADIAIFGSDQFCLSRLSITSDNPTVLAEAATDEGYWPECISDDTPEGLYVMLYLVLFLFSSFFILFIVPGYHIVIDVMFMFRFCILYTNRLFVVGN